MICREKVTSNRKAAKNINILLIQDNKKLLKKKLTTLQRETPKQSLLSNHNTDKPKLYVNTKQSKIELVGKVNKVSNM